MLANPLMPALPEPYRGRSPLLREISVLGSAPAQAWLRTPLQKEREQIVPADSVVSSCTERSPLPPERVRAAPYTGVSL